MKPTRIMMKAFLVAALVTSLLPVDVQGKSINIVSNTRWIVRDANGNLVGNAQNVCLNANAPSNCPPGATLYGYPGPDWTANLSSIPGATWIWAPNINGATSGAANAEFIFEAQFILCGSPQDGSVSVAADNSAEVILNGATTSPVVTSTDWSVLTSATIPASKFLQAPNPNKIQVRVKNAPGCATNEYSCNPAGVVLGAAFADALSVWPKCTDNGRTFDVGDVESFACPPGQTGSKFQVCSCFGSNGFWLGPFDNCVTPPPPPSTCIGNNGTVFSVGQTETLPCPPGETGSATRTCQANGWGPANTGMCAKTCTGSNGAIFSAGQTETLPCPAGQVGSLPPSHTCRADGTWGPTSAGNCQLPTTCVGCKCGARDSTPPITALCPSGTTCQSRRNRVCDGWFIFRHCDYIQTTDWFCDAP